MDQTRAELETNLQLAREAYHSALAASQYSAGHSGGDMSVVRQQLADLRYAVTLARRELIDFDAGTMGGQQGIRRPKWR